MSKSATHYADYLDLRAQACRLCAEMQAGGLVVPKRLLIFAGLPRRMRAIPSGPRPRVLDAITKFLAGLDNKPQTYRAIAEGTGISVAQIRSCCSRNQTEHFERAGSEQVGDKSFALVKLSAKGEAYAKDAAK